VTTFSWDPAGRDERLAVACTDVRGGLVGAAREVLAETRAANDFARRGYASALLGALASGGNLPQLWLRDAPRDPDALMLAARAASAIAVKALKSDDRHAAARVRDAIGVIRSAVEAWPEDPTPFVVMLGLVKHCRSRPTVRHASAASYQLPDPWALAEAEIWQRDRYNRETGRHLLECFSPKCGGSNSEMAEVAADLAHCSPHHSPLRLLPFAARIEAVPDPEAQAEETAQRLNRLEAIRTLASSISDQLRALQAGTWQDPDGRPAPDPGDLRERRAKLLHEAEREEADLSGESKPISRALGLELSDLYASWFLAHDGADPQRVAGYAPVSDFSLLAHGLHLAGENGYAQVVLRYLHPYASSYPWRLYGDPQQVLPDVWQAIARSPVHSPA